MAGLVSEDPRIRVARVADLDALARMWEELEKYHVDLGGPCFPTRQHIGRKDRLCLAAEVDRVAVGFLLGAILHRPKVFERRTYGHIYDVFVDASHRNRGVGEALVNAAMGWFQARRVDRVELYTHAKNELGLRFWKKMGFETTVHIMDRRI